MHCSQISYIVDEDLFIASDHFLERDNPKSLPFALLFSTAHRTWLPTVMLLNLVGTAC